MFNRFPKDENNAKEWSEAIEKHENLNRNIKNGLICIEHFRKEELIGKKTPKLRHKAIPSVFSKYLETIDTEESDWGLLEQQTIVQAVVNANTAVNQEEQNENLENLRETQCNTQCEVCQSKEKTINILRQKMTQLASKLQHLRQSSGKWRSTVHNRTKLNIKLCTTLEQLKEENKIDEKLKVMLEVNVYLDPNSR